MHSVKQLERFLADTRPPDSQGNAEPRVHGPIWRGRNAWVYRVHADWLPGAAALKVCRQWLSGELNPDAARIQFDALMRVERAIGSNGAYRVPTPYSLLQQHACYLAAWIDGPSMETTLACDSATDSSRLRLVGDAGAWLRRFHASCNSGIDHLDTAEQLGHLSERLGFVPRTDVRVSDALAALRASASRIADATIGTSWTHGDFKPANILREHDLLYSIDVAAGDTNVVVFDIAQFLNGLSALAEHSGSRPFIDALPRLEDAFWLSYAGGDADQRLREVTLWLRLVLLLEASAGPAHGPKDVLRRLWRRRTDQHAIVKMTHRLLNSAG